MCIQEHRNIHKHEHTVTHHTHFSFHGQLSHGTFEESVSVWSFILDGDWLAAQTKYTTANSRRIFILLLFFFPLCYRIQINSVVKRIRNEDTVIAFLSSQNMEWNRSCSSSVFIFHPCFLIGSVRISLTLFYLNNMISFMESLIWLLLLTCLHKRKWSMNYFKDINM